MSKQSKLISKLLYRMNVKKESNCIILFGKKGVGKSFLALRFAELLDKSFSLDRVVFQPKQFFSLIKTVPEGACIIYDEIGVGTNARDAQTRANKNMSFIAQMVRSKCITILFTTISWGLVDAQVRNLMDFAIHVQGHDDQTTDFKFHVIEPRLNNPLPLMPHLIYNDANGRPVKYISWTARKASDSLTTPYKAMREKYFDTVIEDADNTETTGERFRFGERVVKPKRKIDINALVAAVRASPDSFKDKKGKFNVSLIRAKLGIGEKSGSAVVHVLNSDAG